MTLKPDRIEVVDSLRGFAVFGILVSHCYYLFFLGDAARNTTLDEVASALVRLLVNDKFYSLFSFLFGLSFSLMLSRTSESPSKFYLRFAWRLLLLGAIGLLHNLHWNDDILSIYAFLGFILLAVSKLDDKLVFFLALLLLFNLPSFVIDWAQQSLSTGQSAAQEQEIAKTYEAFFNAMQHGSYWETLKANMSTYPYKLQYYLYSGRFSFMLGFFFLGLITGRRKLFQSFNENKSQFKKTFMLTGPIALLLTILAAILIFGGKNFSPEINAYLRPIMRVQSPILTLAYLSGMALWFSSNAGARITGQFAIIGKMALTNYVLHSVLGTILLCGYGFGLINYPISATVATLASLPIFMVMISFSHFWLSRFSYGPLEWIWRVGTYLKVIPLKKTVD